MIYSPTGNNISCMLTERKDSLAEILTILHVFQFIVCSELHYIHQIRTDQVKTRQSNSPYNLYGKDKSPHYTANSSTYMARVKCVRQTSKRMAQLLVLLDSCAHSLPSTCTRDCLACQITNILFLSCYSTHSILSRRKCRTLPQSVVPPGHAPRCPFQMSH